MLFDVEGGNKNKRRLGDVGVKLGLGYVNKN